MPALQPFLLAVATRRSELPDAGASAGTTAVLARPADAQNERPGRANGLHPEVRSPEGEDVGDGVCREDGLHPAVRSPEGELVEDEVLGVAECAGADP